MTDNFEDGLVSYEPKDQLVHVDMCDGKIELSIYFDELDENILPVIDAWFNDTCPVRIQPRFSVSSPVDCLIELNEFYQSETIDIDSKPIFDALRAEFIAQVARIDALTFE